MCKGREDGCFAPDGTFEMEEVKKEMPEPEVTKEEVEDINAIIKSNLKEFGSVDMLVLRKHRVKRVCCGGVGKSVTYRFVKNSDDLFARAKTGPSSCDCLLTLLTCGCLRKPLRISFLDTVDNENFYFRRQAFFLFALKNQGFRHLSYKEVPSLVQDRIMPLKNESQAPQAKIILLHTTY